VHGRSRVAFSRARFLERLAQSLREDISEAVSRIRKEITVWRGKEAFDDDISFIAIEAKPHP
jgi:serine phosphatase RsbU (regulator of sigma subunit)